MKGMCITAHGSFDAITVMIFDRFPFIIHSNESDSLKYCGLDILLLENFAKKYNLRMNYVETNVSVSEVFTSEEHIKEFIENAEKT